LGHWVNLPQHPDRVRTKFGQAHNRAAALETLPEITILQSHFFQPRL
jgi:hypothetical protein